MTDAQKEQVRYLRCEGLGYGAIATRLGISEHTVKSFCRRNNLTGVASKEPVVVCRNCGRPLPQYPKRKQRKFCSEACRRAWWKLHENRNKKLSSNRLNTVKQFLLSQGVSDTQFKTEVSLGA